MLVGSFAYYHSANLQYNTTQQDTQLLGRLAKAKEALIAYAIADLGRPGRMLCPDMLGDGISPILSRDDCDGWLPGAPDFYIGWLPWKTLDLPDANDNQGNKFWYATSRFFAGDRTIPPINSDTLSSLFANGGGDIVAVIIAPGSPLTGQVRPSMNISDYLEGDNANADTNFINAPASNSFNDQLISITRQELMAAVEKRVANEVKRCIEQHVLSSANSNHSYPWPAPFSSTELKGKAGSYFGQLPATQPGPGPEALLKQGISDIQASKNVLSSATLASDQLAAVQQLGEGLTRARALYDAIYVSSTKLWQSASVSKTLSTALYDELENDLSSSSTGRISIINSEQTRIRTQATNLLTQIDDLPKTLDESGIDPFPNALQTRWLQFQAQANTANALAIQQILANSVTVHSDIGPALSAALAMSSTASGAIQRLALAPTDSGLFSLAQNASVALGSAIATLQNSIELSRINHYPEEVTPSANQLEVLNIQLRSAPNTANATQLATKLSESKTFIQSIKTGASAINSALNISISALEQAQNATLVINDYSTIDTMTTDAINSIRDLVTIMKLNDDNLTRTSLAAAVTNFKTEQASFAVLAINSTSDRVPYAQQLQNATVNVEFWANIIAADANSLAQQAKGVPIALGEDFSAVKVITGSAYQIADDALSSEQRAARAIQAYINTSTALKKANASSALTETLSKASDAIDSATTLDSKLNSSNASAFPMIWFSSSCSAFQANQKTWWGNNKWQDLVFYQISDATLTPTLGKLTVNHSGNHRVVVITTGATLSLLNPDCPSNRVQLSTRRRVADCFEEMNADTSRDNNATSPTTNFIAKHQSRCFNDRLAY